MADEWRPIVGFPNYVVRADGAIRHRRRTNIRKSVPNAWGYHLVSVVRDGKSAQIIVHRAVAAAYLGPPPDGMQVNHVDGDKSNNCASNLEYVTPSENILHAQRTGLQKIHGEHHYMCKLTDDEIKEVRARYRAGETQASIGARYGIGQSHVSAIVNYRKRTRPTSPAGARP